MKLVSNEKNEQNTVTLKFTIAKDVFDAQTERFITGRKTRFRSRASVPVKLPAT